MDSILQTTRSATASASAASPMGQAQAAGGATADQMMAQVAQQVFGTIFNLVMSQASEV